MMQGPHFWIYALGAPAIALVVCLGCRRHRVLLWLGGLLLIATVALVLWVCDGLRRAGGHTFYYWWIAPYAAAPLLLAETVLLLGGLVRRAGARRRPKAS